MALKHENFDEFFKETNKESNISITLFGEVWPLPSELPAFVMLETYRSSKEGLAGIDDKKQMELAVSMVGEVNLDAWCKKGLTIPQLTEIMKWVAKQHAPARTRAGKSSKK